MKRFILRSVAALSLCAAVVLGSGGTAHAWYKVKNNTSNTVWVSHAYASTSGWFCGWGDGCDDNGTSGWAVHGWWMIAPGGTATVLNKFFANAIHQIYANDYLGHVWQGGGRSFGTPNTAFGRCEGLFKALDMPYYQYKKISTTWCCGGSCDPGDHTTVLSL